MKVRILQGTLTRSAGGTKGSTHGGFDSHNIREDDELKVRFLHDLVLQVGSVAASTAVSKTANLSLSLSPSVFLIPDKNFLGR